MKVESIAEYSLGAFGNTFDLYYWWLSDNRSWKTIFGLLFEWLLKKGFIVQTQKIWHIPCRFSFLTSRSWFSTSSWFLRISNCERFCWASYKPPSRPSLSILSAEISSLCCLFSRSVEVTWTTSSPLSWVSPSFSLLTRCSWLEILSQSLRADSSSSARACFCRET